MSNTANEQATATPRPRSSFSEERISLTVNDPFRGNRFSANKKLEQEDLELLEVLEEMFVEGCVCFGEEE
jgi:hypothetical protein